jgi:long-chain acyl-CoA synthetase
MAKELADRLEARPRELDSLSIVTYGAAPMPEETLLRLLRALPGVRFYQSYGQTELSPVATMLGPEDHAVDGPRAGRLVSAGRPVLLCEVRIVDEEDRERPTGQVGEIAVRGPTVMLGYWRQPDATAHALRDGWMHTGDGGYLDADGYLFVVDRLKDMIISGGENVYSIEVENALYRHPGVAQCAVFGVPDPRWGEAVHAVVVARPGTILDEEGLRAHCRDLIAGYKVPKSIELREEPLPVSGANKIVKTALRDVYRS